MQQTGEVGGAFLLVSVTLEVSSLLKKEAAKRLSDDPSRLKVKEAACPIQCPTFKYSVCSLNQKKLSEVHWPLRSMKRPVLKLRGLISPSA